jgi:hypothetical protein
VKKPAPKLRKRAVPSGQRTRWRRDGASPTSTIGRCIVASKARSCVFRCARRREHLWTVDLVMAEVERPMFASVMHYVGGNQSRAAKCSGSAAARCAETPSVRLLED